MPEWEHEVHRYGDRATDVAYMQLGAWWLFVQDWRSTTGEPVAWRVRRLSVFFGAVEGRARDLDDGKAQALAAAERLQAEHDTR